MSLHTYYASLNNREYFDPNRFDRLRRSEAQVKQSSILQLPQQKQQKKCASINNRNVSFAKSLSLENTVESV